MMETAVWRRAVLTKAVLGVALCSLAGGCGGEGRMELRGTVTCAGERVESGEVRFVPVDDADGPARSTYRMAIVDGRYRTGAGYGLPHGKYRVEVDARKKTGRRVMVDSGLEMTEAEETVRIGPDAYAGEDSPIAFEAGPGADSSFDIELPAPDG